MKIGLISIHFQRDDKDCDGDYYDVEVFIDGKLVKKYGDYYHDKGEIRAEEFLNGVKHVVGPSFKILRESIADRDE